MGSQQLILAMLGCLIALALSFDLVTAINRNETGRAFSLFSIVQFPNSGCTAQSSSTTYGTCYTATECVDKGGSADGNCAAGFGVCCLITVNTCGSTVTTNTSYIRNPNFPSSFTPSSTGTCEIKVSKCSEDICQLRLDFQTMSGTNTGYHMYTEFGATSTDTITLTITYGDTSSKTWNVLLRQISCSSSWKAPTDCVQYFTGSTGTIQSYNFAGG